MPSDELKALEQQRWEALASGAAAAVAFYQRVLHHTVVMLLPGGLVLDDRDAILDSMSGAPWSSYHLSDWRVFHPVPDTAVVAYSAVARGAGADPYSA
jgi:Domain of unknown function (DUF4440)